jgi:hypothetical protein
LAQADGLSLVESRVPERHADDAKGRTTRLIDGAERIDFSYYGHVSGGGAALWLKEWTDPEISPSLIRIDIGFRSGDPRRWPPFIVYLPSGGGGTQK